MGEDNKTSGEVVKEEIIEIENTEKKKKKKIIILVVIAIIIISSIAVVILMNYQPDTEADGQFKANLAVCEYKLNPIQDSIMDAVNNNDMSSFEYWCGQLKTSADICKKVITSEKLGGVDVSSKYLSVKTEYLAYLDDTWSAGYYGEQGDVDNYISYYSKATTHLGAIDFNLVKL